MPQSGSLKPAALMPFGGLYSRLQQKAQKYMLAVALPAAAASGCLGLDSPRGARGTYPMTTSNCDTADQVEFKKTLASKRPGQADSQAEVYDCHGELLAVLSEDNDSFIKTIHPKINNTSLEEPNLLKFDYGNTRVEVRRVVNNPNTYDLFLFKTFAKDTGETHTKLIK